MRDFVEKYEYMTLNLYIEPIQTIGRLITYLVKLTNSYLDQSTILTICQPDPSGNEQTSAYSSN